MRIYLLAAGLAASALTMLGPSLTGHAAVAAKHHSLAKLLLVLAMLALGTLNNFYFGRRVRSEAGGGGETAAYPGRGFGRSLKLEAALGVLVLLATALPRLHEPGAQRRDGDDTISRGKSRTLGTKVSPDGQRVRATSNQRRM